MKICTRCKNFNPNKQVACLYCHQLFETNPKPEKSETGFNSAVFYVSLALFLLAVTLLILAMIRGATP
jgi:hypothetical protein